MAAEGHTVGRGGPCRLAPGGKDRGSGRRGISGHSCRFRTAAPPRAADPGVDDGGWRRARRGQLRGGAKLDEGRQEGSSGRLRFEAPSFEGSAGLYCSTYGMIACESGQEGKHPRPTEEWNEGRGERASYGLRRRGMGAPDPPYPSASADEMANAGRTSRRGIDVRVGHGQMEIDGLVPFAPEGRTSAGCTRHKA